MVDGDAGHAQSRALQLLGEVGGGGFALDRGIGSQDDFFDFAAADPADQVGDVLGFIKAIQAPIRKPFKTQGFTRRRTSISSRIREVRENLYWILEEAQSG